MSDIDMIPEEEREEYAHVMDTIVTLDYPKNDDGVFVHQFAVFVDKNREIIAKVKHAIERWKNRSWFLIEDRDEAVLYVVAEHEETLSLLRLASPESVSVFDEEQSS